MLEPRYVDARESAYRLQQLRKHNFVPKMLSTGDVTFPEAGGGTVGIEHKSVSLLLQDMTERPMKESGHRVASHLSYQARSLVEAYEFPVLLVVGPWGHDGGRLLGHNVTWEQAWNQLQTLQDWGIRLQLATSEAHAIERVLSLAENYGKDVHDSMLRDRSGNTAVACLCLVNGIGPARARALLEYGGTLEALATSSINDLGSVPGVSRRLAEGVYEFFHRDGMAR